jgi:hypothetical protein
MVGWVLHTEKLSPSVDIMGVIIIIKYVATQGLKWSQFKSARNLGQKKLWLENRKQGALGKG